MNQEKLSNHRSILEAITKYIQSKANLDEWKISVSVRTLANSSVRAFTICKPEYLIAEITYSPDCIKILESNNFVALVEIVCHELAHLVLSELYEVVKEGHPRVEGRAQRHRVLELATTRVSRWLLGSLDLRNLEGVILEFKGLTQ
jgi:hypothetical protein